MPDSQEHEQLKDQKDQKENDATEYDRAPRQKNEHRNPVKSAEETQDIPTKHGAIK